MRCGITTRLLVALTLTVSVGAKRVEAQSNIATARDSAGIKVITLTRSLDFRKSKIKGVQLRADLELGGISNGFAHVADVTVLPNGRFAVLDRGERTIIVFDRQGRETRRFGKKGDGPGEFADPIALVGFGSRIAVRDRRPNAPLLLFDALGHFLMSPKPVAADWDAAFFRGVIPRTTDGKYRMPAEDLTRRILALDGGSFAVVVQPRPALPLSGPIVNPPTYVLRFDSAGVIRDTVDRSIAPTDYPAPYGRNLIHQQWFAGRAMWAAGNGWVARGHADSTSIEVRRNGKTIAIVRLPASKAAITDADKKRFAEWYFSEDVMKNGTKEIIAQFKKQSRRQLAAAAEQVSKAMIWAPNAPTSTGHYGDGACLWIAGFNPNDTPTGTAATWLRLNVHTGALRVFTIPRQGARVREIGNGSLFMTYHDDLGVHRLERYTPGCE